jgi:hypothetical protein
MEESAGTYNTYMSQKTRSYFDRLLPVSRHARTLRAGTYKPSTAACNSLAAMDFHELRKWLSDDADLYQPMNAREFNPASDELEANFGHSGVSDALVGTSNSTHLDAIPFQQFHNRAALGILIGTAEKVSKRVSHLKPDCSLPIKLRNKVVKSSGARLESTNTVSSEPSHSLSTTLGIFSNVAGQPIC